MAPTPFALAEGTAHQRTLILPEDHQVNDDLIEIATLVRQEVDRVVVAYSFDLTTNDLTTKLVENPSAGTQHVFRAYRLSGDPPDPVAMTNRAR